MANKKPAATSSGLAEQAMNRVLAAERDAAQAIEDCEDRARDIVQAARQRANRIASRTDERTTLMQMRANQRVAATLKQVRKQEQQSAGDQAGAALDDTRVNACMEVVAENLTTATTRVAAKPDAEK